MEIAVTPSVPTYAGGLGVLAGDTLRAAADLAVPMVAVTLLYRRGYFYQRLDRNGRQVEEPVAWPIDDFVEPMDRRVEQRPVQVRAGGHRAEAGRAGATGEPMRSCRVRAWRFIRSGA